MLLRIDHETKLTYSAPVAEHVFELRMAPRSDEDQTVLAYRVRTTPPAPAAAYRDGFGNRVDLCNHTTPCSEVVIRATSFVRTHRRPGPARLAEVRWLGEEPLPVEALDYLRPSPLAERSPPVEAFLQDLPAAAGTVADVVQQVLATVGRHLKYEKQVTTAWTPVGEALALGRGVCQDFSHLFLAASRALGLPARYVSGYVNQAGELATHAWCQVWGGRRAGWVDVDPTYGGFGSDDHVLTAVGRDYGDVPPNRGVWKGQAEETIAVAVQVQPVDQLPADWNDLGAHTAWPGTAPRPLPRRLGIDGRHPPRRNSTAFRQQQSQQQQCRSRLAEQTVGAIVTSP